MTKGWSTFKFLRVLVLLFILFIVAVDSWLDSARSTDWNDTLNVVVVPINPEKSDPVADYILSFDNDAFKPIEDFFDQEASRYLPLNKPAFKLILGNELHQEPPKFTPNENREAQWFDAVVWSLKTRYWVYKMKKNYKHLYPDIMLFVNYYDPAKHRRVRHSLGLEKGLYSIVYAFGNKGDKKGNHIVIAHELLHTLGASDKYALNSNQPLYPIGYANRDKRPLYPQKKAELMAGRIPISEGKATMPDSLVDVLIGPETAMEINWKNPGSVSLSSN